MEFLWLAFPFLWLLDQGLVAGVVVHSAIVFVAVATLVDLSRLALDDANGQDFWWHVWVFCREQKQKEHMVRRDIETDTST